MPGTSVREVVVLGGCGRVGLPLGVALARRGLRVTAFDIRPDAVAGVQEGRMPFLEAGADDELAAAIADGSLHATTDPSCVASADVLLIVIGTPIDEHLNPDADAVVRAIEPCEPYLGTASS